jgi:hypothetical protein
MKATGLYGPKCHIKFNGPKKQTSKDLFNQNYCSSSAGDIKVTNEDGKQPCYQKYKESYGAQKGGPRPGSALLFPTCRAGGFRAL